MAPTFWVVRIGAALAALAIVALAAWWIIGRPITAATQAAQAKVDAKLGQATGQAAVDAIPAITEAQRQRVAIDVQVQKGVIDVRQAPGAATDSRQVLTDRLAWRYRGNSDGGTPADGGSYLFTWSIT